MTSMEALTLRTAAGMRTVRSILFDTFIVEEAQPLFAEPKSSGPTYYKEAQRLGRSIHNLDSPHPYLVEKLVNKIHTDPHTSPEDKKILQTRSEAYPEVK